MALLVALPMLGDPQGLLPQTVTKGLKVAADSAAATRQARSEAIERRDSGQPSSGRVALRRAPAAEVSDGPYRITPERRALLNTIRYAEGTWVGGSSEGYRVLYGGGRFEDLRRHPEVVVVRRYSSAAAGAYQFLPSTWKAAATKLELSDFGPGSQDQAALYLIEQRGALSSFDREGLNRGVLARLSAEWASLPASHGGSYYGQPVKSADELISFYNSELSRLRGAGNVASRQGLRAG